MRVSIKDIQTINQLSALVDGNLEALEDKKTIKYWEGLAKRVENLEKKMRKQREKQQLT